MYGQQNKPPNKSYTALGFNDLQLFPIVKLEEIFGVYQPIRHWQPTIPPVIQIFLRKRKKTWGQRIPTLTATVHTLGNFYIENLTNSNTPQISRKIMSLQPYTKNGKVTEFPYQQPTTSVQPQPTQPENNSQPAPLSAVNNLTNQPSPLTGQIVIKSIKKQAIQNGIVVPPRRQWKTHPKLNLTMSSNWCSPPKLAQFLPTRSLYLLG